MRKYIDEDALKNDLYSIIKADYGYTADVLAGLMIAERVIDNAPTVDAVEVVRCGDCKHYKNYGKTSLFVNGKNVMCGWCHRRIRYDEEHRMLTDDFCSYGERRKCCRDT